MCTIKAKSRHTTIVTHIMLRVTAFTHGYKDLFSAQRYALSMFWVNLK